jgi:hypothetical protein
MVYRYSFERVWVADGDASQMVWVLLNPATGDTDGKPRPTLQRCVNRAQAMGFSGLTIVNLFAFRATSPSELKAASDPVGLMNDEAIRRATERAEIVIAAWGAHGRHLARGTAVARLVPAAWCLGHTKRGEPRHPLYVAESGILTPLTRAPHDPSDREDTDTGTLEWPGPDAAPIEVLAFAGSYDAYERWASDPERLEDQLRPLHRAWTQGRSLPPWAGIDAIRAYLFYLFRVDHFRGATEQGLADMSAVIEAARNRSADKAQSLVDD